MASLIFEMQTLGGDVINAENVLSYELSRDAAAPCDGLRLSFLSGSLPDEITEIKAYSDGELIFSGFCDLQKSEALENEYETFIYARSAAALLVDNEAQPFTYESPTARSLFIINAEKYGFKFDMEDTKCSGRYSVLKGCSCYSAINRLVYAEHSKNIEVTPDMRLIIPDGKQIYTVDGSRIISEKLVISRGGALSQIDYKVASEPAYSHHIKSGYFESRGIKRTKKVNLSALYDWQREIELKNMLKTAAGGYYGIELTLDGAHGIELYSRLNYFSRLKGGIEDYGVRSVCITLDSKGERTYLKLGKDFDLKETVYVD